MKRVIDIVVSAFLLILLSPLLGLIAIAVLMCDGSPVFYRQERVGRNLVPFYILKFRTMVVGADQAGGFGTARNDPRVTSLGRRLRAMSVDELPQLWNIIKGDMSLVGPRPFSARQSGDYSTQDWRTRHTVRPGLTGLAQISGRSKLSKQEKVRLDLVYINDPRAIKDLIIFIKTPFYVLMRRGDSN